MPAKYRKNKIKPRGVSNRNRGLDWIRANASEGVLYFADDDNTYDLEIFDEVRIGDIFFTDLFNRIMIFIFIREHEKKFCWLRQCAGIIIEKH